MIYTWADDFSTYEDACRYYGVDTPDQIEREAQADYQDWLICFQDQIEIGGPMPTFDDLDADYIPF